MVRSAATADVAREMGRSRDHPICSNWDEIREQVLWEGMLYK